jgi:hypothetical protein
LITEQGETLPVDKTLREVAARRTERGRPSRRQRFTATLFELS